MRPGGGKRKGSAFERRIAEKIGEWLYDDKFALWRTTNSGGRATVRSKAALHPGDIGPAKGVARRFPLSVECKFTQTWSFQDLLTRPKTAPLFKFWKQAEDAAGKTFWPWLVFTRNHAPDFVMCSEGFRLVHFRALRNLTVLSARPTPLDHRVHIYLLADVINELPAVDVRRNNRK